MGMQCLSCLSARGYHLTGALNASSSLEPSIAQPEPNRESPWLGPWTIAIIRGEGSDDTHDGRPVEFSRGTIYCM